MTDAAAPREEPQTEAGRHPEPDIQAWRDFTSRFATPSDPLRTLDSIDLIREAFAAGWNVRAAASARAGGARQAEFVTAFLGSLIAAADVEDAEVEAAVLAYLAPRDAAVVAVLAYRASPPEYPGLALVPVEALDALAANYPLPAAAAPVSEAGRADAQAWLVERGQSMRQVPTVWWTGREASDPGEKWTTDAWQAIRFPDRESAQREIDQRSRVGYGALGYLFGIAVEHGFAAGPRDAGE